MAVASFSVIVTVALVSHSAVGSGPIFAWETVANAGDIIPTADCESGNPGQPEQSNCRRFNSFNPPSVNVDGMVVFRARSKGSAGESGGTGADTGDDSLVAASGASGQGSEPVHGVYVRDMGLVNSPVVSVLDRDSEVPQPNNTSQLMNDSRRTTFMETPSFPRIDMWSSTVATRGNHPPVWKVIDSATGETVGHLGTTGLYTNPFGALVTGASKLGNVTDFRFFEVPEIPGVAFDTFPGAPSVIDTATIVFKGNYTIDDAGSEDPEATIAKTGVYFRNLSDSAIVTGSGSLLGPAAGMSPVVSIANTTDTLIPGAMTRFGSTSPPSAAVRNDERIAVFAGFDNEAQPTTGGIYLAQLSETAPSLKALVSIGDQVPGEKKGVVFNRLGEGISFDGRFVAFWGAWGTETRPLKLQCRAEGSVQRFLFCQENANNFLVHVPVKQGLFVHDVELNRTRAVANTPNDFDDFLFWNFSGVVPGMGESHESGEEARWRSATFVAVSGLVDGSLEDAGYHVAFKGRRGTVVDAVYVDPSDGIFLGKGPGSSPLLTALQTGSDGTVIDPEATYFDEAVGSTINLPVVDMGIERDGFRGRLLAINVSMGTEESGWGGVYITDVSEAISDH
ncbi:MAG: hypothetical protein ACO3Z6_11060 [Pseudomonadales bacterium]